MKNNAQTNDKSDYLRSNQTAPKDEQASPGTTPPVQGQANVPSSSSGVSHRVFSQPVQQKPNEAAFTQHSSWSTHPSGAGANYSQRMVSFSPSAPISSQDQPAQSPKPATVNIAQPVYQPPASASPTTVVNVQPPVVSAAPPTVQPSVTPILQSSPLKSPTPLAAVAMEKEKVSTRILVVIGIVFGLIEASLTLRLFFKLLAANSATQFVRALYQFTDPIVRPFLGIFGGEITFGKFVLEISTIIAMVVYSILGYAFYMVGSREKLSSKVGTLIGIIFSLIEASLTFRLFFKLLAANPNNQFVSSLIQFTDPLISPFLGIFGGDIRFDRFILETANLVAMVVYSLVGYGFWWATRLF